MAAAGDLTTLDQVSAWLKLSGSADAQLLGQLITAASGFVQAWCGRTFAETSYSQVFDGLGGRRMLLPQYPITAVSGVTICGLPVQAGDPQTSGYWFTPTELRLTGGVFTRGQWTVAVSWTAGYAVIPPEISQAVNELVAIRYKERDHIGKSSDGMANQTTAYIVRDMPPSVSTLLQQYRKVVPV